MFHQIWNIYLIGWNSLSALHQGLGIDVSLIMFLVDIPNGRIYSYSAAAAYQQVSNQVEACQGSNPCRKEGKSARVYKLIICNNYKMIMQDINHRYKVYQQIQDINNKYKIQTTNKRYEQQIQGLKTFWLFLNVSKDPVNPKKKCTCIFGGLITFIMTQL